MKDNIISFETAKLAKEKGLIEGIMCYNSYCIGYKSIVKEDKLLGKELKRDNVKGQFHLALAPTQSLLQKWLREKHNIYVEASSSLRKDNKREYLYFLQDKMYDICVDTWEEALEKGLFKALQLIDNQ